MVTSGTQPHPPAVQTFFFVRSSQSRLKGTVGLKKHELKQLASNCANLRTEPTFSISYIRMVTHTPLMKSKNKNRVELEMKIMD